jgi:hypothetical protein
MTSSTSSQSSAMDSQILPAKVDADGLERVTPSIRDTHLAAEPPASRSELVGGVDEEQTPDGSAVVAHVGVCRREGRRCNRRLFVEDFVHASPNIELSEPVGGSIGKIVALDGVKLLVGGDSHGRGGKFPPRPGPMSSTAEYGWARS